MITSTGNSNSWENPFQTNTQTQSVYSCHNHQSLVVLICLRKTQGARPKHHSHRTPLSISLKDVETKQCSHNRIIKNYWCTICISVYVCVCVPSHVYISVPTSNGFTKGHDRSNHVTLFTGMNIQYTICTSTHFIKAKN